MFMDEIDAIDAGTSLDRGIEATRRKGKVVGGRTGFSGQQRQEYAAKHPTLGQRNTTAAINDRTGEPWWIKTKGREDV